MATKNQPAKKSAATKTSSQKVKKTAKKITKALDTERHPDRHQATGKYKFFFVLFVCTTIFFAALSVWLFVFSTEVMNKYESVEACARAHTRCDVHVDANGVNVEGKDE